MSRSEHIKAIIWIELKKYHKMRMIFIALIVSPVLAYKHLLNFVSDNINWNGEAELYMAPEIHRKSTYQPTKVKMLQREEKRKIKDLLYVLNEHTCIKTYTTEWVKNCFFPIEIKF